MLPNALLFVLIIASTCTLSIIAQDDSGLGAAVAEGRIADVKRLLDHGANVNAKTYSDYICGGWYQPEATAVMVAASCNSTLNLIGLLLDHGASMTYRTKYEYPVVALAASNDNSEMVSFFIDHGVPIQSCYGALMLASEKGYLNVVKVLLDRGAEINWSDNYGRTALIIAAKAGKTEICKFLLDRGANIDAVTNWAMTALSWAARKEQTDTFQFLLKRGASKRYCVYPMCTATAS